MTIAEMTFQVHGIAEEKGFHDDIGTNRLRNVCLAEIAVAHSILSGLAQEIKRTWPDTPTDRQVLELRQRLRFALLHFDAHFGVPSPNTCSPLIQHQSILMRLCLVHTEISEAVNEVLSWSEKPTEEETQAFGIEMADAAMREADLAGTVGYDLEACITAKMAKNRERPRNYGTAKEATIGGQVADHGATL